MQKPNEKLLSLVIILLWEVIYAHFYNWNRLLDFVSVVYDLIELIIEASMIPQFDSLYDVCGCVMSPTSGIYWVDLGFINNYKEPQLWLVLLRYSADVASAFPWVVIYGIRANLVTPCGRDITHKVGPNEDVRDLSRGDCNTPIWLIMWCMWVCDESHIGYLLVNLGFINNYKESQLWLVILRYNADVVSVFPWVTYKNCDALIWLIVWCVWVCDESHIGYLLGRSGLY